MKSIRISDITMKQSGLSLSFKEKLELSKLLDKLGVSVIELEEIENVKIDSLLIKSIASAVKESAICVPVELNNESVEMVWQALKDAKAPASYQFMRLGYFCPDSKDCTPEHLVFNRSVSLKDSFKPA